MGVGSFIVDSVQQTHSFAEISRIWPIILISLVTALVLISFFFATTFRRVVLCGLLHAVYSAVLLFLLQFFPEIKPIFNFLQMCMCITLACNMYFDGGLALRTHLKNLSTSRVRSLTRMTLLVAIIVPSLTYLWLVFFFNQEPHTYFHRTSTIPPQICSQQWIHDNQSNFASASSINAAASSNGPTDKNQANKNNANNNFGASTRSRFQAAFNRYVQFRANALSTTSQNQTSAKWLVFIAPNAGLGNRIQGLLSSLLLAMLTNRIFAVVWQPKLECAADLVHLFDYQAPFLWHFWLAASDRERSDYETNSNRYWVSYCATCPLRRPPRPDEAFSRVLCEADPFDGDESHVAYIASTQWFAPLMMYNPHFRAKFCEMFGEDEVHDVFGLLFRAFLRPSTAVQQKLNAFKQQHQLEPRTYVGLQMRLLEANAIDSSLVEAFWRCGSYLSRPNERWFVATDDHTERQRMKSLMGDRVLFHTSVNQTLSRGMTDVQDALVEILLLGEAREVVLSPYSTFGRVAVGSQSVVPHMITSSGHCFRDLNSEPCFHGAFRMPLAHCWRDEWLTAEMINQHSCMV